MDYNIKYEIPTYELIMERLNKLVLTKSKFRVREFAPITYSKCGLPIMHYAIGNGPLHLTIVGGTHGNEIISVDFVTQLMATIANGEGSFANFDENTYTIDFFPIQNPESFVISTSGIKTEIKDSFSEEEITRFCKNYWSKFREADIAARENPDLHDKHTFEYQMLFKNADYNCIVPQEQYDGETDLEYQNRVLAYEKIRNSVKKVVDDYPGKMIPGYPVFWQATADGVNLNSNSPFYYKGLSEEKEIAEAKMRNEEPPKYWNTLRYSNLLARVPSPIGVCSEDPLNFKFAIENQALINFLDDLIRKGEYAGMLLNHGTAGWIYNRLSASAPDELIDDATRFRYAGINQAMAHIYQSKTSYLMGNEEKPLLTLSNPDFTSVSDIFNNLFPGVLLIELSKMGGNPIAPYGDKDGNYMNTMRSNIDAVGELIRHLQAIHGYMYDDKAVIIPSYDPFQEDKPRK
ncbi:MAG: hypothetical protein NC483_01585 [Ruminococcus sp.]|nr:hypothetical protein [Ruminococcus sp.]